ncbi:hypothetical protein VXM60_09740 [Shewanella khirikhana]|uniref:hypothetical protein n=1 Tax=Shewanella khirikhana TaxID=1965282 RepID=UPI0030D1D0C6
MISNISVGSLRERCRLDKIQSYDNLVSSIESRLSELAYTDPLKRIYAFLLEMQITNEEDFREFEGRDLEFRNQSLTNLISSLDVTEETRKLILDCIVDPSFETAVASMSERELVDLLTKNRKLFTCEICLNGVYQNDKFRQCDVIENMSMAIVCSCNRFQKIDQSE